MVRTNGIVWRVLWKHRETGIICSKLGSTKHVSYTLCQLILFTIWDLNLSLWTATYPLFSPLKKRRENKRKKRNKTKTILFILLKKCNLVLFVFFSLWSFESRFSLGCFLLLGQSPAANLQMGPFHKWAQLKWEYNTEETKPSMFLYICETEWLLCSWTWDRKPADLDLTWGPAPLCF